MSCTGTYSILNKLSEIPALKYEGWLWLSDSRRPMQIDGALPNLAEYEFENDREPIPFIVEAYLFAVAEKVSIAVKSVDNGYRIGLVDWSENGNGETTQQSFIAVPDIGKKIKLRTAWIPVEDELCEMLPVLQPAWSGFVGFKVEEKQEND